MPYLIIELGGGDKLHINKPATTGFFFACEICRLVSPGRCSPLWLGSSSQKADKKMPARGGHKSILGGEMEETGCILPEQCCAAACMFVSICNGYGRPFKTGKNRL
ncbi:hypothetical protein [Dechloromonas denitrificans]|uniref:hypothetical protein n=1 Tax=Dechloromonas denitrificans TaxID=281362 RepID=UPI0012FC9247|nr:hypothetical protein [Dechloromonas denitrificans]